MKAVANVDESNYTHKVKGSVSKACLERKEILPFNAAVKRQIMLQTRTESLENLVILIRLQDSATPQVCACHAIYQTRTDTLALALAFALALTSTSHLTPELLLLGLCQRQQTQGWTKSCDSFYCRSRRGRTKVNDLYCFWILVSSTYKVSKKAYNYL